MKLAETIAIRAFALVKIPLIAFVRPQVIERSLDRCVIKIPLRHRTKNHLGSMYFGVLATGADCAGGFLAMEHIRHSGKKISLVFKDFHADFLKRPEADVLFSCEDGGKIATLVKKTIETGTRQTEPIIIVATCPKTFGDEPVARFTLGLSLKAS